jgi:hypothetical protein
MSDLIEVDGKGFVFPAGWQVWKYDNSTFHRRQFQNFAGGSQAVDVVAVSPDNTLWLLKVKDYRRQRRSKTESVFAEVAAKVRSTLAGLATARLRANKEEERSLADQGMRANNIRVVLHLDQPYHVSLLFPQIVEPKSAMQLLQIALRPVDRRAVCYGHGLKKIVLPWTVVDIKEQKT